ncbi:MAG: hypothetical protein V4516_13530, partial [Pseudomonadota bacterium]
MTDRIDNLPDLLLAAAAALAARDHAAIEHLMRVNEGWLQPEHEAGATGKTVLHQVARQQGQQVLATRVRETPIVDGARDD